MSDARLLTDVSLALRQWRRSWSRSEALQWVESELATMGSDERSRYEQIYEAAHAAAATNVGNALDARRGGSACCPWISPDLQIYLCPTLTPTVRAAGRGAPQLSRLRLGQDRLVALPSVAAAVL